MNLVFSLSSAIIAKYKKKVQNKHSNLFCALNETNKHIGNKISVSILAGAVLYFKYL